MLLCRLPGAGFFTSSLASLADHDGGAFATVGAAEAAFENDGHGDPEPVAAQQAARVAVDHTSLARERMANAQRAPGMTCDEPLDDGHGQDKPEHDEGEVGHGPAAAGECQAEAGKGHDEHHPFGEQQESREPEPCHRVLGGKAVHYGNPPPGGTGDVVTQGWLELSKRRPIHGGKQHF